MYLYVCNLFIHGLGLYVVGGCWPQKMLYIRMLEGMQLYIVYKVISNCHTVALTSFQTPNLVVMVAVQNNVRGTCFAWGGGVSPGIKLA